MSILKKKEFWEKLYLSFSFLVVGLSTLVGYTANNGRNGNHAYTFLVFIVAILIMYGAWCWINWLVAPKEGPKL